MRYSFDFTIPASTPANLPYEDNIVLDVGRINQIIVRFKAGCHNRVYVSIYDSLEQIVPAKSSLAIYGDQTIFRVPMTYPVNMKPYTLNFKGWSPDTRYKHTISVWVDLEVIENKKDTGIIQGISHLLKGGA